MIKTFKGVLQRYFTLAPILIFLSLFVIDATVDAADIDFHMDEISSEAEFTCRSIKVKKAPLPVIQDSVAYSESINFYITSEISVTKLVILPILNYVQSGAKIANQLTMIP